MRSHSRVVQGCAGEESRNGGTVLMPTHVHSPDDSVVAFPGAQDPIFKACLLTVNSVGNTQARPIPSLAPREQLLVHSGVSFSRRGRHASFSPPSRFVSEHCLLTPEIP